LATVALIQPLAWELSYAASATLKSKQTNKQNKTAQKNTAPNKVFCFFSSKDADSKGLEGADLLKVV